MVNCELCGIQVDYSLSNVKIAGSDMSVCKNCKNMGVESNSRNDNLSHTFRKRVKSNSTKEDIVPNFTSLVNSALAKKGLNVQQLARMLNIKESTLNKYLTGKIKSDVDTAKKLEKFFEIKLVEEVESSNDDFSDILLDDDATTGTTLGDLLKKK